MNGVQVTLLCYFLGAGVLAHPAKLPSQSSGYGYSAPSFSFSHGSTTPRAPPASLYETPDLPPPPPKVPETLYEVPVVEHKTSQPVYQPPAPVYQPPAPAAVSPPVYFEVPASTHEIPTPVYQAPEVIDHVYEVPAHAPAPTHVVSVPAPSYGAPAPAPTYVAPGPVPQKGMPFDFEYAVKDIYNGLDFDHESDSDGKVVEGGYRVVLPDGRTQIVTYTADNYNGYRAEVTYEGEAQYPETKPYNPVPVASYEAPIHIHEVPAPTYEVPAPTYEVPAPTYEVPAPTYEVPSPIHTVPSPIHTVPSPAVPSISYGVPTQPPTKPASLYGLPNH